MTIVRRTLEEIKASPFRFTPEERARLDAMTEEEIERNALEDPDNPPLTDEQLERGSFGRDVRLARERLGLTQAAFAERFRINLARLRDWEQGRFRPDSVAWAYVRVIARAPEVVDAALAGPAAEAA